jgi:hypothetical protein
MRLKQVQGCVDPPSKVDLTVATTYWLTVLGRKTRWVIHHRCCHKAWSIKLKYEGGGACRDSRYKLYERRKG